MELAHLKLVINHALADESVTATSGACPRCFGQGIEIVTGKGARPCECKRAQAHATRVTAARIPPRYAHCRLATFAARTPSIREAAGYALALVRDYPAVTQGVLYMGSVGTGKTHLAVSILRALAEKGVNCLFYEFGSLLKEIQNSYSPIAQTSELKVLAPVFNAEVLVLDELGASKPTDWVRDTLMHIINTRYNEQRLTIFTTNYLDERKHEREETLQDRVGVRVRSRLYEMCKTVIVDGPDFRRQRQ